MKAKVKASGETVEGRLWDERWFKAWPPDERLWLLKDVDIINN